MQEFSVNWDENGKITETRISPVYTLEEYQKAAAEAIYEILKKKRNKNSTNPNN
jgi:hypothetical protein